MLRVALWASGSASGNSTVRFERLVDERSQDSLRHGPEIRLPLRDALWVRNQVVQFSFHVLRFAKHAWGFLMSCPCNSMAHFNFSACLTMRRRSRKATVLCKVSAFPGVPAPSSAKVVFSWMGIGSARRIVVMPWFSSHVHPAQPLPHSRLCLFSNRLSPTFTVRGFSRPWTSTS